MKQAAALLDRSGTIQTAGSSQLVAQTLVGRQYLFFQNLSLTATMYLSFSSGATPRAGSIRVPPGAAFCMENKFVTDEAWFVYCDTVDEPFTAKEA